jgi:hypothetical protein
MGCENEEKKKNGGLPRKIKWPRCDFHFFLSIIELSFLRNFFGENFIH